MKKIVRQIGCLQGSYQNARSTKHKILRQYNLSKYCIRHGTQYPPLGTHISPRHSLILLSKNLFLISIKSIEVKRLILII